MKFLVSPYDCLYNYADNGALKPDINFTEIYQIVCSFSNKEYHSNCQSLKNQFSFHQHSYLINGCILWEIKYKKLYLKSPKKYQNFADFCKQELNLCVWQGNRIISAARVGIVLIHNGFAHIPTNESQCRELSKYNTEEIVFYWQKILEKYQNHWEEITAVKIWATIQEIKIFNGETIKPPKWKKLKISHHFWEFLLEEAFELYLDVEDYLQYLTGFNQDNLSTA